METNWSRSTLTCKGDKYSSALHLILKAVKQRNSVSKKYNTGFKEVSWVSINHKFYGVVHNGVFTWGFMTYNWS